MLSFLLPFLIAQAPEQPQAAPHPAKVQTTPDARKQFRYTVAPMELVHLGSLGPKEAKDSTWTFTNRSDKPLGFRVADLSPGVTVAGEAFKAPVPPKGTATLTLHTEAEGWVGYQRRAVRVVTDDGTQPSFVLRFDMDVRPDLSVDAANKHLDKVAPYESPQVGFAFARESGEPLELELESPVPAYLDKELVRRGAKGELRFTLRPGKLAPGQMQGLEVFEVKTNAPMQPHFTLYLDWNIQLPVTPTPSRLVFMDEKHHTETLKLAGDKPFRILSATVEGGGYSVGVLPEAEAKEQSFQVHRDDNTPQATLVLKLSGVQDPLRVPLIWKDPKAEPAPEPAKAPETK